MIHFVSHRSDSFITVLYYIHYYPSYLKMSKKGINWTDNEIKAFLDLCLERRIIKIMDGKKHRHLEVYRSLEPEMRERGFQKTAEQMKIKMTKLKQSYYKCKRANGVSGANKNTFLYFDHMDNLYGDRPTVVASTSMEGVDTGLIDVSPETESDIGNEEYLEDDIHAELTSELTEESGSSKVAPVVATQSIEVKKRTVRKPQRSYDQRMQALQENLLSGMSDFFEKQSKINIDAMRSENKRQQIWESKMLRKEHEYQMERTERIMQTFLQAMTPSPLSALNPFQQQPFQSYTCPSPSTSCSKMESPSAPTYMVMPHESQEFSFETIDTSVSDSDE